MVPERHAGIFWFGILACSMVAHERRMKRQISLIESQLTFSYSVYVHMTVFETLTKSCIDNLAAHFFVVLRGCDSRVFIPGCLTTDLHVPAPSADLPKYH